MAEPFSLGASIIGVVGLTIQIGELLVKFGMNWSHAPEDVKHLIVEIQTLKTTLSITYTNAIINPNFKEAMEGVESALLTHFKQKAWNSGKQVDFTITTCKSRLEKLLVELNKASKGHQFGWHRIKTAFLASDIREAVEDLHRQCQAMNNLVGIDSLTLAVETLREVRAVRQDANDDRKARQDWESKNDNMLVELKDELDDISQNDQALELVRFLNLISATEYASQQRDFLSKKTEGTGSWLLASDKYQRWTKGTGGTLFCYGMPGSGKTIMSSNVINELSMCVANSADVYLAYVYCNFRLQHEQSPDNILSSILRQLIRQRNKVPDHIKSLYSRDKTLPSLAQIANALESCIKEFRMGYIIIDALDELSASFGTLRRLVTHLCDIQCKTGLNLFVTSRQIYRAEDLFSTCIKLEVRADDHDVEKYVQSRLPSLPKYVKKDSWLQVKIQSTIVKHVQGMFLLAQLHLESLMDKKSPRAMRRALENLNSGKDAYEIAYEKAMDRIEGQTYDHRQLAIQVLSWITFAKRPLTTQELQHALAVDLDYQSDSFDLDNITDLDYIVSVCAGLVTVDKEAGIIRLVHHTTQQYFDQTRFRFFPQADWQIATTCMRYLSYQNVCSEPFLSREQYHATLENWPLFGYASEYWHEHIDKDKHSHYISIINFLQTSACTAAYQAVVIAKYAQFEESDYYFVDWDFNNNTRSMALHWAVFIGHDKIATELFQTGCDVNLEDFEGMTPLMVAARQGHSEMVKIMLQKWQVEAKTSHRRLSPLLYAATFNQKDVVQVLLENSDIDDHGSAPLGQAIALGRTGIVELLLADSRVHPFVTLQNGDSVLTIAAASGFLEIVDLLLSRDEVEVNHLNGDGHTALQLALIHGHRDIAQRLINDPRTYDDLDGAQGLALLSLAMESGDADLLHRLIQGLEIDLNSTDSQGKTLLVMAVQKRRFDIVSLLLKTSNIDINARDKEGRTALSWAVEASVTKGMSQGLEELAHQNTSILQTLLASNEIDLELRDNRGWSPLFYAASGTCEEMVSLLLSHEQISVDRLGPSGTTALFHVKKVEIAKLLIEAGADFDWKNSAGITPIMHIYHNGHECHDMIEFLCQQGADLQVINSKGETLLLQAALRGDVWMVNLLLRNGADPNVSGKYGKSILFATLEHAPKIVSDIFVASVTRGEAKFEYDKELAAKLRATDISNGASKAPRYQAVIGLLLKWGADKDAISKLDLLKLKSKKASASS
ncbi:ankyrin repeat-containing domain protein [Xylariaceae sp. FL1651]|nr:ankyrin repeat-containing domain protein [Xylariaceae sp. FL1651]